MAAPPETCIGNLGHQHVTNQKNYEYCLSAWAEGQTRCVSFCNETLSVEPHQWVHWDEGIHPITYYVLKTSARTPMNWGASTPPRNDLLYGIECVFSFFFAWFLDCTDTWSLLQARFSERADQNKLSRANLIRKTYNRHGDPSLSSVLPPVLAIVKVFHDIFGGNKLFELNWIEHVVFGRGL